MKRASTGNASTCDVHFVLVEVTPQKWSAGWVWKTFAKFPCFEFSRVNEGAVYPCHGIVGNGLRHIATGYHYRQRLDPRGQDRWLTAVPSPILAVMTMS